MRCGGPVRPSTCFNPWGSIWVPTPQFKVDRGSNMLKAGLWVRQGGVAALALVIAAGMMGCASKQEKAMEQARKQAVATGEAQQVTSVDKNGITTTSVVEPPAAGQKEPTVVTTTAPPNPDAPKPAPKEPTVSVLRDDGPDLALDQTP